MVSSWTTRPLPHYDQGVDSKPQQMTLYSSDGGKNWKLTSPRAAGPIRAERPPRRRGHLALPRSAKAKANPGKPGRRKRDPGGASHRHLGNSAANEKPLRPKLSSRPLQGPLPTPLLSEHSRLERGSPGARGLHSSAIPREARSAGSVTADRGVSIRIPSHPSNSVLENVPHLCTEDAGHSVWPARWDTQPE